MRVSDFHFDLPEELIAQHPPAERGASRMLVVSREHGEGNREHAEGNRKQEGLRDAWFRELPEFLLPGDLMVLNDSRVLPARLFATRAGLTTQAGTPKPSGVVEVLLVEEADPAGDGEAVPQGPPKVWNALVRPAKKVRVGERLEFRAGDEIVLRAEVLAAGEFGERTLRFEPVEDFYGRVSRIGHMPLPPYIRREQSEQPDSEEDRERYQTVYGQRLGSAAAPTAGLHFTAEMLERLRARGVEIAYVTLHVGLGTFQPVRVERVEQIRLHSERYTLPAETAEALNRARAEGRRVIAVGTTTTRTLEHIAAERGTERFAAHEGATSIFIAPGHRFRVVQGLLTNFHLPESTLLMLVSAFAGPGDVGRQRILAAYAHAVQERYRFFSYGDCMLIL